MTRIRQVLLVALAAVAGALGSLAISNAASADGPADLPPFCDGTGTSGGGGGESTNGSNWDN